MIYKTDTLIYFSDLKCTNMLINKEVIQKFGLDYKDIINSLNNEDSNDLSWFIKTERDIPENLRNSILSLKAYFKLDSKENLCCYFNLELLEGKELTKKENKIIIDYLEGQISDGWGENGFYYDDFLIIVNDYLEEVEDE